MSTTPTLLWFRQDLRLADQPALAAALERGGPVIPVFILDEEGEGRWRPGGASRWWLHVSLEALAADIAARGGRLILRRGAALPILLELARTTGAQAVYWNRRYEPHVIERDVAVKRELRAAGLDARSWNEALLFEPKQVVNRAGQPFKVFTPFWRHCLTLNVEAPVPVPLGRWPAPAALPSSEDLAQWGLIPARNWHAGFREAGWKPGERGAQERLRRFAAESVSDYERRRDLPAVAGTSGLSPHLHFGEVSPRQVWAELRARSRTSGVFPANRGEMRFLAEIGWREFARHLLYHFPNTPTEPLRDDFRRFPWREDEGGTLFQAWCRGRTGYPIVDAGMRELWTTGWMHNRVRMIAASFLVKHLRLPWQKGSGWFWDTLLDADLAANTLGWQWSAGCGADAAPYFRIFNPVLQGGKFDSDGAYVRRWVPELGALPSSWIHAPWEAPGKALRDAGVELGTNYPRPIVDHAQARAEALEAWKQFGRAMTKASSPDARMQDSGEEL